jgi:hypothetical protein
MTEFQIGILKLSYTASLMSRSNNTNCTYSDLAQAGFTLSCSAGEVEARTAM